MPDDLLDLKRAVIDQKYFHISCASTDPAVVFTYRRLNAYEIQVGQVVKAALAGSIHPAYNIQPDTKLDDEMIAYISIKGSESKSLLRQYQKYKANLDHLLLLANRVLDKMKTHNDLEYYPNDRYPTDPLEVVSMGENSSLTSIYQAGNKFEAETIRLLLESFEIPVELIGESVGKTMGLGGGPLGEVSVYVPSNRVKEARDLIARMDKGEFELDSSDAEEPPEEPD